MQILNSKITLLLLAKATDDSRLFTILSPQFLFITLDQFGRKGSQHSMLIDVK